MTAAGKTSWLARIWERLKAIQNWAAVALTKALLFVLYFTVFAAVAIVAKLLGRNLLEPVRPLGPDTHWLPREPVEQALEPFARQF